MASSTLGKKSPLQANAKKEKKADNWKCRLQWRHHHVPVGYLPIDTQPTSLVLARSISVQDPTLKVKIK